MPDKFTDNATAEAVQYSLGQPSVRTGLGGYSMKATIVAGVGFGVYLLFQLAGHAIMGLLVVLPITAIVAMMVTVKIGNRSLAENIQIRYLASKARKARENEYVSGAHSRVPGGRRRLPGLLARTEIVTGVDTRGAEFAAIVDKPRREITVLLDCQLTGQLAITQAMRNDVTAEWARWLGSLSLAGDIEQAVVVVGSRPGTGQLVHKEVESIISDDAPAIAQIILHEAAEEISIGIPEDYCHIALTFKVTSEALKDDAFLHQIGTRLPTLYSSLDWAGIQAAPMVEAEVVARAHSFFNPAAEADFEELHIEGEDHNLGWKNAGPAVHRADRSAYHHDGCVSVTWEMKEAPRSTFEDRILTGLMAPHPRIDRKRVALVYRPYEAGSGATRVENEHRDAMVAANSSKKVTSAKAELRLEHTEAARRAQAKGAQLGRYSLFVTATMNDANDVDRVKHEVEHLAASSSVRLHVMKDQQDAAFIIASGLGQSLWGKSNTSKLAAG
ncbi:hypothetical protein CIPA99_00675 [Corynebacterium diphtheriae]|nr:hypothetical protein W5M_03396 [Corynebacterium diphtheriae bv. intermedius str. NCTC 5011]OWM37557.1 hypothetical protein AZF05_02555 [Corynebacterium diphtheriae bv. intermedius]CAB0638040.1 hypothetical protein CIPA99_00675 [Corynebacterium diphtheriae]